MGRNSALLSSCSRSDLEDNLHQYIVEQLASEDMVESPLVKEETYCLVLPSKGSSWRTRRCAVP